MSMRMHRGLAAARCRTSIAIFLALLAVGCGTSENLPEPVNHIALLLDVSGTYQSHLGEAIKKATNLLEAMAATKLHRWELGSDVIVLISLDAMPEVIWKGTLRELKSIDATAWKTRFQSRTDYASCTDIGAAFRLAAANLEGDARSTGKYLFAFTDLVDEPPASSIKTCRPVKLPSLPPADFPWEAFRDVSASIFWVPPDQKLVWNREVQKHGLESSFLIHTVSESQSVSIAVPPKPKIVVTDAERKAEQESYRKMAVSWARRLLTALACLAGLAIMCFLLLRFTSSRRGPSRVMQPPRSALARPRGVPRGPHPLLAPERLRRTGAPSPRPGNNTSR